MVWCFLPQNLCTGRTEDSRPQLQSERGLHYALCHVCRLDNEQWQLGPTYLKVVVVNVLVVGDCAWPDFTEVGVHGVVQRGPALPAAQ